VLFEGQSRYSAVDGSAEGRPPKIPTFSETCDGSKAGGMVFTSFDKFCRPFFPGTQSARHAVQFERLKLRPTAKMWIR